MKTILERLGLTPKIVARFVVSVDRRPGMDKSQQSRATIMRAKRAAFVAAGLTCVGTVRQRSPNGTRKIYRRK